MPDLNECSVFDVGTHTITIGDKEGNRIGEFGLSPEHNRAMLAIGLVAMTSGRKVWVRVDAANEGGTILSISLL